MEQKILPRNVFPSYAEEIRLSIGFMKLSKNFKASFGPLELLNWMDIACSISSCSSSSSRIPANGRGERIHCRTWTMYGIETEDVPGANSGS